MDSRKLFAAITVMIAYLAAEPSAALPVISTGPFTPTSPTFVVPIEITGASDLVTWQFDLSFNPNDFQINLLCDPSTDSFCDPINGPVTEGPLTSKNGTALSLFVPGFADNTAGLLSIVSGAYSDIPPGPSGDGILAFVEFSVQPNGTADSVITVQNALVTEGTSVVDEPPMLLLLFATLISALVSRRRAWRRRLARYSCQVLSREEGDTMESSIRRVLESALGLFLVLTAVSVNAQTTGAGPYYATPSWDQTLAPNVRFIVLSNLNNEAVLDRETGLVWQRTPDQSTKNDLDGAQRFCNSLPAGGRFGWRVPTMAELGSLFIPGACTFAGRPSTCYVLPSGHPFNVPLLTGLWSTTRAFINHFPNVPAGGAFLLLGLADNGGLVAAETSVDSLNPAWCVRGPS